jgi:glycosyltransferase involved in cell wall biosynthesis
MLVAHVLSSLRIGGGERVALELASRQLAAQHQVVVVSLGAPPEGPLGDAFREHGVTVYNVPKRTGFDLTLSVRLAALFLRLRPTVVHTHNRVPLIYGVAPGKLAGARVVHTRHGPGRGSRREQWLRRSSGYLLDAYVAVSPALRDISSQLGDCRPHKLSVIENGIDLVRFGAAAGARAAIRAQLGIPADAWVVGSVGRLAPEKEYPLFVRAAAPLLGRDARLLIVGDGPEAERIRAEAEARSVVPFVHLPGARNDVPPHLAAMDVFVLSSRMEGLPLSVLEAMAAGLPVVAPAIGGIPGVIRDGETGFLYPQGDEAALAARLAALRADPAAARAVGARGRAHVQARHSSEAMASQYLELYARVGAPQ